MARQVLPIVGAVVGAFFGSAQLGFAIGSIIGNAVDPQVIKGPKLGDAGLQTSAEGVFRPVVFGTAAIKGNVISRGNRQVKTQRTQQGKGGGPVTEEQRVYWTFQIRLGEPLAGISRIWQDEKLVYDVRPTSSIMDESAAYAERFRFYDGSETQLPDPDIEAYMGVGDVSAYRGTSYVVFPNFDLTDRRESIPDFRFEVVSLVSSPEATTSLALFNPGGGSTSRVYPSPDGLDWTAPSIDTGVIAGSIGSGPEGFLLDVSTGFRYSLDDGVTWLNPPGTLTGGNPNYGNGRFLGSGGPAGVISSELISGPYIATTIPGMGSPGVYDTAADDGLFYALVDFQRRIASAATIDGVWTLSNTTNIATGTYSPIAGHNGECRMGGDLGGIPRIVRCPDRVTIVPMTLPAISGATGITRLHYDKTLSMWFAGTDNGRILYDAGGGWQLTAITLNARITDITSNGQRVIASTWNTGTNASQIVASDDGINWTVVKTGLILIQGLASRTPTEGFIQGDPVPLSSIVASIHDRVGHDAAKYNVSELTDLVEGFVLAGDYSCADSIRTLMPIYFFDASEHDAGVGYRVNYIKRGKPVVDVITGDDIIQAPEKSVREDALERPRKLHLHYQNPTIGYAPAKATSRRDSPDARVVGETSIQVPVSYTDVDEVTQTSDKLLKVAWVEVAGVEDFTLGDDFLELVPTDCIGVSLRGQTRRMRVVQEMSEAGCQAYKLIADRQSAYTSNVTGIPVPEPTPPLPSIVGETVYEFLDIPALNDNNDRLIWYDAASGQTSAWYGAQTQHKAGADVEFSNSATFNQNTIMGVLLEDVPSASEHYTDTTNTVRVHLYTDDVIESLTDAQFLSEGGSFALKNDDDETWEILQYRDAEDEGNGVFSLTYLARGRLNTGGSEHMSGASFVLLDAVQSVDAVTAWIDTDIVNRAVSFGNSPDVATQYTDSYTAKSQTEFPVAHLFLDRDVNTIEAMAVPRHRFGTEDNPIQSVNWLGYRWTATDGTNTATIPDGTSPTISFDATGWSSPITVTVAQINRFTGPGPTVSEDIA